MKTSLPNIAAACLGLAAGAMLVLASLVRNLSVLTLLMGMLGTVLGLQHTVRHVEQVEPGMRWIFVVGLRETLNNFDAAMLILIPTMLCYTAAMFRLRQDKQ